MAEEKNKSKIQNANKKKEDNVPRISINNTLFLNASANYQSVNIDNSSINNINGSFDTKNDLEYLSKKLGNVSFIQNNGNNKPNTNNESNQMEMEDILMKMAVDEGDKKNKFGNKLEQTNDVLNENTNQTYNKLNTSFENNRKKNNNTFYQPSNKLEEFQRKKEEKAKTHNSFHQNSSFLNETKEEKSFNNICCTHEEELKKAKQKIDHLNKKMKLILEENKVPSTNFFFNFIYRF